MKDGADVAEVAARQPARSNSSASDVIGKAQRNQVFPFLRSVQAVDDENVVETAPVERPNDGAAYKAGAPGNNDSSAAKVVHRSKIPNRPLGAKGPPKDRYFAENGAVS